MKKHPRRYGKIVAKGLDRVLATWNVPYLEDVCGFTVADFYFLKRLVEENCSLDGNKDSAPLSPPQPSAGNSWAVTPLRGAV